MDNDKQIATRKANPAKRFLDRPLDFEDKESDFFDLEGEFSKSKHNRSYWVPLAVLVFLAVLGAGAWWVSSMSADASKKSTATIGTFEDLKLKELFDTARRNQKDLEDAHAQIAQLTSESQARQAALRQTASNKADIAQIQDPSGQTKAAILAQLNKDLAAEVSNLQGAIKPWKVQADEAQKKIDSYDDRIGELNKKNQQVLDSQQRLFDLERQKLVDEYEARLQKAAATSAATVERLGRERDALVAALNAKHKKEIEDLILKFNPVVQDPQLLSWIQNATDQGASYPPYALPDRLAVPGFFDPRWQSSLDASVVRSRQILARLQAIPSVNSVPGLLTALDWAVGQSLQASQDFLKPAAEALVQSDSVIASQQASLLRKDSQIADLQDLNEGLVAQTQDLTAKVETLKKDGQDRRLFWSGLVQDYMTSVKADGLVLGVTAEGLLDIQLKSLPDTAIQATALVRDNQTSTELATLTLDRSETGWTATLVKLNDKKRPIKPFDKIEVLPKTIH